MNGTSDYIVELYIYVNGTSPVVRAGVERTVMSGVLVSATG